MASVIVFFSSDAKLCKRLCLCAKVVYNSGSLSGRGLNDINSREGTTNKYPHTRALAVTTSGTPPESVSHGRYCSA